MAASGGSWSKGNFSPAKGTQTTGGSKQPVEYLYNANFQGPQKVAALKALPITVDPAVKGMNRSLQERVVAIATKSDLPADRIASATITPATSGYLLTVRTKSGGSGARGGGYGTSGNQIKRYTVTADMVKRARSMRLIAS